MWIQYETSSKTSVFDELINRKINNNFDDHFSCKKRRKTHWFQLLQCEGFQLFFGLYDSKLNVFDFSQETF